MHSSDGLLGFLVRRQEAGTEVPSCATGNEFDGHLGLRVSSIVVILFAASSGALFPILARKNTLSILPSIFFVVKYFGSGVIIATAFIHLLAPATEALSNPCLTGVITEYPWAQGIALMSVFSLFFVELLAMRYATFSTMSSDMQTEAAPAAETDRRMAKAESEKERAPSVSSSAPNVQSSRVATTVSAVDSDPDRDDIRHVENYAACLTSIFILEFGVVFHSVLIGLTLAVSGAEFRTLYIVLTFHQLFEGLGLGTRLATVPWPASRWQTPYLMAIAYGLSTPTAIAVGLGVRDTYRAEGATTLVVAGVFDSLSAGILLYTGLVELMAHEFLFTHSLKETKTSTLMSAFGCMVLGAFLMSLLGKWA